MFVPELSFTFLHHFACFPPVFRCRFVPGHPLLTNGNGRCGLPDLRGCHFLIQIRIEPFGKILRQHFAHVPGNARDATLMQIDHCRFPVRVGIRFLLRADNPLRVFLEIGVRDEACRIRRSVRKQLVRFHSFAG